METLIFLAVSGVMLTSAMLLVSGQQQRTEFTQAVRNFESSLQDVANDVSTGYAAYPFTAGQSCKVGPSGSVTIDNSPVGSQQRCIFVGRVIQLSPQGSNRQAYQVYTVVGKQRVAVGGKEVSTLTEAAPVALAPGSGARAGMTDYSQQTGIGGSARIEKVTYKQGGTTTQVGAFGFFSTFQGYAAGSLNTGSTHIDVAPVSGTALDQPATTIADRVDAHGAPGATITPLNPNGGITVCLLSTGSRQYALVRLGGSVSGQLAVTSTIESGSSCP